MLIALNPWWVLRSSTSPDEVGGQATALAGLAHEHELAVEQVGHVGHRDLERVHHEPDVAAVEVAAVDDALGLDVDDGVVADAVELDLDGGAAPAQRVDEDAEDVRGAADRVAILQALHGLRILEGGELFADPLGGRHLAGVALDAM